MIRLLLWIWRLPIPDWVRLVLMTLANPRFVVTASAVVFNERGEVLLFKHTYRSGEPWGLPGGFIKRNEEPSAAVTREVEEESGLDVMVGQPLYVGRDAYFPCVNVIYTARLRGGEFRPSAEVCEARCFAFQDLPPLSPDTRRYIEMAVEEYGQPHPNPPRRAGRA